MALNRGLVLLLATLLLLSLAHLAIADWSHYSDEDEDSAPYKGPKVYGGRVFHNKRSNSGYPDGKPSFDAEEDTDKEEDENNYDGGRYHGKVKKPVYSKNDGDVDEAPKKPVYKNHDDGVYHEDDDDDIDMRKPLYKKPYKSYPFRTPYKPIYNKPKLIYQDKPYNYKPKPKYSKPDYEKPIYTKPVYEKPIYTKPAQDEKPLPKDVLSPIYSYKQRPLPEKLPFYKKPAPETPDTPTYSSPASSSVKEWLNTHNAARAEVGIAPMVWSVEVAAFAEKWANQRKAVGCGLRHSDGPYGENIFWGSGDGYGPAECVGAWVREKENYNYADNSCSGGDCGHYTQIIWANSVRLGCARAKCDDGSVFMTCNYDPPGNYIATKPY